MEIETIGFILTHIFAFLIGYILCLINSSSKILEHGLNKEPRDLPVDSIFCIECWETFETEEEYQSHDCKKGIGL